MIRVTALALPLVASVAGCAADYHRYPSLATRPAEKRGFEEPAAPAPLAATPDPALDAAIAAQTAALADGATAFAGVAARADAATRAARGDVVGGDRWIAAQAVLGELDEGHAHSLDALDALDQLALDRAAALQPAYPALDAATQAAKQQVAVESARIEALQHAIPAA